MKAKSANLAAMAILVITYPAHAHVTLEGHQAAVGTFYKAVFAVPHGCAGSATTKIRVQIPDGVMKMRPLDKGLAIEPGKIVKLAPGGYHLMMFDLKGPLKQGEKVPVTLVFEKAGKVAITLDVQGIGAQGPSGGDGMMKMSPGMKM